MSGYCWAKTPDGALFVLLIADGRGFVPGVEGAIDLQEIDILEPVQWPAPTAPLNLPSNPPNCGARAAGAARECVILPFAASA